MKISVVIPMYNASKTIRLCLEALSLQEILPYEVIVVDNNSTDNSLSIVQESRECFKHLNIALSQEPKKGPSAARNRGAYLAKGEIIAFTDSDCLPDKGWIKGVENAFIQDKDLDIAGGVPKASNAASTIIGKFLSGFWLTSSHYPQSQMRIKEELFDTKYIVTFNCAVKVGIFKKINGFDESFDIGEDFDLALRALEAGAKVVAWNKDMVVHHMQDMSFISFLKREVFYAKGIVLVINRHFRNKIILCIPYKHCHWDNKLGVTIVMMSNRSKTLALLLLLFITAFVSPIFFILTFLSFCIYFCLAVRMQVKKNGSSLTFWETILVFLIYCSKQAAVLYGRLYWSMKYKIFCV